MKMNIITQCQTNESYPLQCIDKVYMWATGVMLLYSPEEYNNECSMLVRLTPDKSIGEHMCVDKTDLELHPHSSGISYECQATVVVSIGNKW